MAQNSPSNKMETIKVMGRVRPLLMREENCEEIIEVASDSTIYVDSGNKHAKYKFDHAFSKQTTQEEVFEKVSPFIMAALDGFNCTVFAYGQTGTGKTHTMLGVDLWEEAMRRAQEDGDVLPTEREELWGIIPRAMRLMFDHVEENQDKFEYQISCSYLELYNEKLYDLLRYSETSALKSGLDVREDRKRGTFVPGAAEVMVGSEQDVLTLLWHGAQNRAVSATDMNEHSSRSHTILQLIIEQSTIGAGSDEDKIVKRSKLNLVDLAGSEKWKTHQLTEFSEQRIQELTSINRSLSTLGNCVRALLRPNSTHIPYRDSKLTRLLQDSLGGNTKTMFIVTLSAASVALDESLSTLQFADRAKRVVVHASVNEELDSDSLVKKYEHEISKLKQTIRDLTKNGTLKELTELKSENAQLKQSAADRGGDTGELAAVAKRLINQLSLDGLDIKQAEDDSGTAAWMHKYHNWLKCAPLGDVDDGVRESMSPNDRLIMMEWSVLMQASNLASTKQAFMKERRKLMTQMENQRQQLLLAERQLWEQNQTEEESQNVLSTKSNHNDAESSIKEEQEREEKEEQLRKTVNSMKSVRNRSPTTLYRSSSNNDNNSNPRNNKSPLQLLNKKRQSPLLRRSNANPSSATVHQNLTHSKNSQSPNTASSSNNGNIRHKSPQSFSMHSSHVNIHRNNIPVTNSPRQQLQQQHQQQQHQHQHYVQKQHKTPSPKQQQSLPIDESEYDNEFGVDESSVRALHEQLMRAEARLDSAEDLIKDIDDAKDVNLNDDSNLTNNDDYNENEIKEQEIINQLQKLQLQVQVRKEQQQQMHDEANTEELYQEEDNNNNNNNHNNNNDDIDNSVNTNNNNHNEEDNEGEEQQQQEEEQQEEEQQQEEEEEEGDLFEDDDGNDDDDDVYDDDEDEPYESNGWQKHLDPATKYHYYWNENSGHTQWERPSEYESEDETNQ